MRVRFGERKSEFDMMGWRYGGEGIRQPEGGWDGWGRGQVGSREGAVGAKEREGKVGPGKRDVTGRTSRVRGQGGRGVVEGNRETKGGAGSRETMGRRHVRTAAGSGGGDPVSIDGGEA